MELLYKIFTEIKEHDDFPMEVIKLPTPLHVPTGKIVVTDLLCYGVEPPIIGELCPGEYVVKLAGVFDNSCFRVVAAMLEVKEQPPLQWITAYHPKTRQWTDKSGQKHKRAFFDDSCINESGAGCLMDYETALLYKKRDLELSDMQFLETGSYVGLQEMLQKKLDAMIELEENNLFKRYVNFAPYPISHKQHNIVGFYKADSGAINSYWGMADQSEIVCLVVDFDYLATDYTYADGKTKPV